MWNWIETANVLNQKNFSFIIATIIENFGSTPREIGAKMIIKYDGSFEGTIGGGALEKSVLEHSKKIFTSQKSELREYSLMQDEGLLCGGKVKVYFELIGSQPQLYIFGAGHVAQALCNIMKDTPFKINLIDYREEWIFSEKIPSNINRHQTKYTQYVEQINYDIEKTYIVVMTPGHLEDQEVVEKVLKYNFKYLGLMGSLNKWNEIKTNLQKSGYENTKINKINCPIGLKIGGKTPAEISISIASEIIKVYNGKK